MQAAPLAAGAPAHRPLGEHHLISKGRGRQGFGNGPKSFFLYDPADIYFVPAAVGHQIIYFTFTWNEPFFSDGKYLFERLAATNYSSLYSSDWWGTF